MYDGHIYCKEYKDLKDYIVDILNGEIEDYDVDALADHIQELYDNGECHLLSMMILWDMCRTCKEA